MDPITTEILQELSEWSEQSNSSGQDRPVCVSIFTPMYRAGRETQQNDVRFGNAVKSAEAQLRESGCGDDIIYQIMAPARKLIDDHDFWQHQSDGLAVFLSTDYCKTLRLPCRFDKLVFVGNRFHLKPLIRVMTNDHEWFILAVSPKRVRLLKASTYHVEDLEPSTFPDDLRDALNIDEFVSSLQFHSTSRKGLASGGEDAVHHGQGGSDPDVKKQDEILQYFHRLNHALCDYLSGDHRPLIFAGVGYLFPIFKETCDYKHLVDEPVTGNPDETSGADLHENSKKIIVDRLRKQADEFVEQYRDKAHTDWAADDPVTVFQAARMGQVETLLMSPEADRWVVIQDETHIEDANERDAKAVDLINRIAVDTLANGGRVISTDVANDSGLAALFRSPVGQYVDSATNG